MGLGMAAQTEITKTQKSVLLIDDDPNVRDVTGLMLEELGYCVRTANNGARGLAALDGDQNFDLAVVDFAMPGMDGIEVAKRILAARPSLPIVMMTGYADAVRWSAPRIELHLLEKPFRLDQLASVLRAVLRLAAAAMSCRCEPDQSHSAAAIGRGNHW